jgi:Protein of unknown function (DUF2905).
MTAGGSSGPLLVTLGAGLVIVGILVWTGALSWFGRLPGDIRIERETLRVYIPLMSLIVVSAVLNLIFYLARRWF